jgi:hypothetical protein
VAAGPGLDALLGLERSVSNAMVTLRTLLLRLLQRGTQHGTLGCGLRELSLILRDRFTRRARFKWR